jgi:hypothetical protein
MVGGKVGVRGDGDAVDELGAADFQFGFADRNVGRIVGDRARDLARLTGGDGGEKRKKKEGGEKLEVHTISLRSQAMTRKPVRRFWVVRPSVSAASLRLNWRRRTCSADSPPTVLTTA